MPVFPVSNYAAPSKHANQEKCCMNESSKRVMERLGDDMLSIILTNLRNSDDRKSFSLVCKQWCKIEGINRSSLRLHDPSLLHNFLPRFPNLTIFESSVPISNTQLKFITQTCPRIQVLNLSCKQRIETFDEFDDEMLNYDDFDDVGLCDIAVRCVHLEAVFLRRRKNVGNVGVVKVVSLLKNLVKLDLCWCSELSDKGLEAIGTANCLRSLNLQGCWMITDVGLRLLTKGCLCRTLEKLVLAECDRITDNGVLCLKEMKCLEELSLAECGPKVTDIGGVAIATMESLKKLNLSWLVNLSDVTVVALAQSCRNLLRLELTGCELVSGDGIRALASHELLTELLLARCDNFSTNDIEQVVLGCETLEYLVLDKRLWRWIPVTMQEKIMNNNCWIEWM